MPIPDVDYTTIIITADREMLLTIDVDNKVQISDSYADNVTIYISGRHVVSLTDLIKAWKNAT